jgi:hypothetical protein
MIHAIRTTTACLVLALTLLAILPQPLLADDGTGTTLRRDDPGTTSAGPGRFDFERFLLTQTPLTPTGRSFSDTTATPQPSHGWSSYSAAKKTWIIVGIAVGAIAVGVAVSSHHGSHSGGGGGGGY